MIFLSSQSIPSSRVRAGPMTIGIGMLLVLLLVPGGIQPRAAIFDVTTPAEFQAALTTAQGNGQDDTINVAAGTYNLTSLLTYDNFSEAFSLTIAGAGAATTILDGGGATRILNVNASTTAATVTVRGMTFQNGFLALFIQARHITLENSRFLNNTNNPPTLLAGGGASLSALGNITVSGCEYRNNFGDEGAGGLNIQNRDGTTLVSKNLFVNNAGGTQGAGAAWIRDTGFTAGSIAIVNNIIDNNVHSSFVAQRAVGGARVDMSGSIGSSTLTLTNNTIVSNRATTQPSLAGGVFVSVNSATSTVNLYNNILFGNLFGFPLVSSDLVLSNFTNPTINLFNNIIGTFTGTPTNQANNSSSDPMLDATAHLQAGSPAVDNGTNAAPSVPSDDIDGEVRPLDGNGDSIAVVDIGADEAPGVVIPVPDIAVSPVSITFPDVPLTQSSTTDVTLSNTGTDNLSVTGIALATGTHYSVAVGGSNACPNLAPTLAAGNNCTVQVTFAPATVANNITDMLTVTSNDPDEGTVNVPLSGNGIAGPTPDISVAPTAIVFNNEVAGDLSTPDNVTISNNGSAALNVSSISLDDNTNFLLDVNGGPNGCGAAPFSIAIGGSCSVSVTFAPQTAAMFAATLSIASNDPDTPNATVSLSGTGTLAPAPDISVPASADFGEVVVNNLSAPTEVAISNVGNLALDVSSIALDAATDFTLDLGGGANPCGGGAPMIAAGGSCTVAVVFAPTAVGALLDNLTITTVNDPDEPIVKVSLSGTGIDNVTPVVTSATGSGPIMLDTSANAGTSFSDVESLLDTDPSLNQTGKPSGAFPHGILRFTIQGVTPGDTISVNVTYPAGIPSGSRHFEVEPGGFSENTGAAYDGSPVETHDLTDGGPDDDDGTADGTITHTFGVATAASTPVSGSGSGCSCRISGDGWNFADGAPTAGILLLPFLWLAVARRRSRRRTSSGRLGDDPEARSG